MNKELLQGMTMTNEQIEAECEQLYLQIKKAKQRLEELRGGCNHEETSKGDYILELPHVIFDADMCKCCGKNVTPNPLKRKGTNFL